LKAPYISGKLFHLVKRLEKKVPASTTGKDNDAGRFLAAMNGVTGRRLTYEAVMPRE
jgi:hypothetical protein